MSAAVCPERRAAWEVLNRYASEAAEAAYEGMTAAWDTDESLAADTAIPCAGCSAPAGERCRVRAAILAVSADAPRGEVDLEAIRVRCEAATPGPWKIEREELSIDATDEEQASAFPSHIGPIEYWEHEGVLDAVEQVEADAAFISHARTDVPALLAEVERLWRVLRQVDGHLGAWVEAEVGSSDEIEAASKANAVVLRTMLDAPAVSP